MSEGNPYPGLRPFDADDAEYFFGRERQVDELLPRLRDHRFVAVLGLSGSGKSSLVRAGLIPALRVGHLTSAGTRWRMAVMRPGSKPMEALASALDSALGNSPDRLANLRKSTNALLNESRAGREPDESLLVVVDQFEELFRVEDVREAEHFVDLLLAVEQDVSPVFRTYVVLTMRTDRLGECARFDGLAEALNRSQYLVPKLGSNQLREAIEGPAALTDTAIEPGLVQQLVVEASEGSDRLPLLQHLLMILWEKRHREEDGSGIITLGHYQDAKSAADALNDHADRTLSELTEDRQRIAGSIFRALTGGAERDSRRPRRLSQLAAETGAPLDEVRAVAEHFHAANFLTSPDRGLAEDWEADITHESLIRQWKMLDRWTAEEAKDADDYRYYSVNALRDADPLTGRQCDAALEWLRKGYSAAWAARYGGNFEATVAYINRSVAARAAAQERVRREARKERARRRMNYAVGVLLLALLGIGNLAFYALQARRRAESAQLDARHSEEVAHEAFIRARVAQASAQRDSLIAREQADIASSEKYKAKVALGRAAVLEGVANFEGGTAEKAAAYFATALRSAPDSAAALSWITDLLVRRSWRLPGPGLQNDGKVVSAAFSRDGRRVVTASDDRTARVWDAGTGKAVGTPLQHQGQVVSAAFSPDGRRVVTASRDRTARIWETETGKLAAPPLQHGEYVASAAFSPDGRRILTTSGDRTARVWDAMTGRQIGAPLEHVDPVALFSPDGRRVLTISADDKTARMWEPDSWKPVGAPMKHDGAPTAAAFSPDGRRLVSFAKALLWDGNTGAPIFEGMGHDRTIRFASFSPNGLRLVTSSDDGSARVWSTETGNQLARLNTGNIIRSAAFSPDGLRVVTASDDMTARVWDVATGKSVGAPLRHDGIVVSAEFSPDGRRVLTASEDKTARLWEAETAILTPLVLPHFDIVWLAVFSPDGRRVMTASHDSFARVWAADTGKPVSAFAQHAGSVRSAAFSPDGRRVVTGSDDTTAQVWDAATGKPVIPPLQHGGVVWSVAFSPDGRRVVTASDDQWARVWNAVTGKAIGDPMRLGGTTPSAEFSPDGRRVVTSTTLGGTQVWNADTGKSSGASLPRGNSRARFSPDGRLLVTVYGSKAQVWEAETGKPVGAAMQNRDGVASASFSPDGTRVVTASFERMARVWDAGTGKPVGAPMQHDGGIVYSAAFSPDGRLVATAGDDNTARLWDAETGRPAGAPLPHDRPNSVKSAVFSPDGRRLATADSSGMGRVWMVRLACCGSQAEANRLASLMEAVSGYEVSDTGSLTFIGLDEQRRRMAELRRASGDGPAVESGVDWMIRRMSGR